MLLIRSGQASMLSYTFRSITTCIQYIYSLNVMSLWTWLCCTFHLEQGVLGNLLAVTLRLLLGPLLVLLV